MGIIKKLLKSLGLVGVVSRESIVHAVNGNSHISENPNEEEKACAIAESLVEAWEECRSNRTYEVRFAIEKIDGILKECPQLWEAYAARGFVRVRLIMEEERGGIVGVDRASLQKYVQKRIAEKSKLRWPAIQDLEKACKKLRNCKEICQLRGFELSMFESRLEDIKTAWQCQSCGRVYSKSQTKCVYMSCRG